MNDMQADRSIFCAKVELDSGLFQTGGHVHVIE